MNLSNHLTGIGKFRTNQGWGIISVSPLFLTEDDPQEVGGSLLPAPLQLGEGEGILPLHIAEGQRRNMMVE